MAERTAAPALMAFRGEPCAFASPAAALAACEAAARVGTLAVESVHLHEARGRILATDVLLPRDSPPFDHSAMDGYAIAAPTVDASATLTVVGESCIGRAPPTLGVAGAAIRISTGAPLPEGTDRVIRREDVHEFSAGGGSVSSITVSAGSLARSRSGENVRRRAENAKAGSVAVAAGTTLTGAHIGAIAACGLDTISVRPLLSLAIVTTGDELAPLGTQADAYAIHDSNGPALYALASAHRWLCVAPPRRLHDDSAALASALREILPETDALILTGGVSMGHRDPVRAALEVLGARMLFHGLPQRPGKPMLAAIIDRAASRPLLIFGLPGNPLSAMVTATRIAVPAIAALAGAAASLIPARVVLAHDDGKRLDLWWHRPVRITDAGTAEFVGHRGSGDLIASAASDGFVELPPRNSAADATFPGSALYFPWPR